jgi:hypothetical protein
VTLSSLSAVVIALHPLPTVAAGAKDSSKKDSKKKTKKDLPKDNEVKKDVPVEGTQGAGNPEPRVPEPRGTAKEAPADTSVKSDADESTSSSYSSWVPMASTGASLVVTIVVMLYLLPHLGMGDGDASTGEPPPPFYARIA